MGRVCVDVRLSPFAWQVGRLPTDRAQERAQKMCSGWGVEATEPLRLLRPKALDVPAHAP